MDIFVKRPVIAIVVSLILLLSGLIAVNQIPIIQFPQVESSNLVITTQYPGASPDVVQGFITDPIERVAMTVPGLDYVDSVTTAGQSTVTIWLKLNEDSSDALAELNSRLDQIKFELPANALDPSVSIVRADQSSALFYLNVLSDSWSRAAVTDYMARHITPQLAAIEGVQRIGFEGGRDPAMRVWLDPMRMASTNTGADEVLTALQNNNVLAAIGRTETNDKQINLLTNSTLQTVADFESLIIRNEGGALVRLKDVARIELGEDRGDGLAMLNKDAGVFLSVWSLPGANAIEIGDEVYKLLETIKPSLPAELEISIGYDATLYMRNALSEIITTLLETIALVGAVVLLLMGSLRTALVPLVTIPISILGAIALISIMGFTLNLLTILAIVLSVGLVVDDAIVVVENVARHMREGKSRLDAALISSRELLAPIISMTLTLAAVYAPIGFVSGLTGALFREFTFTLAIAVLISGVVAVTLSPIMSAYVNADYGHEGRGTRLVNRYFEKLRLVYAKTLNSVFVWRSQTLFMGIFLSLLLIPFYLYSDRELAPVEDEGGVQLIIEAPADSRVEYTGDYMLDVVTRAQNLPGFLETWQVLQPTSGFAGIEFVDYDERDFTSQEMRDTVFAMLNGITGLSIQPILPGALPTAGQYDVELVIQSADSYEVMAGYIDSLIGAAFGSGYFIFVDTDLKINQSQARLNLNFERLADLGFNVQQVSNQLATLISEQEVNRFDAGGKSYRVIPMVEGYARHDPQAILDLKLSTPSGTLIPLRSIATIEKVTGPQALGKFNQQRSFRIVGGIRAGTTSETALASLEAAAEKILPTHYTIDYAGVSRPLRKEGNSLFSVLLVSLGVVYLLLSVQFNSFRLPLVVLAGSVPLALCAAMLFTFLGFTTINIYAQIGFITLVGLIAKNAILITEFASQLQHQGRSKLDAITESSLVRLRPILMTTMATVIGHFPLVLVTGAGAEARNSIGIILVAGMLIGTLLTLFVLPCVYLLISKETEDRACALSAG